MPTGGPLEATSQPKAGASALTSGCGPPGGGTQLLARV